ncbi:MauE/DoxX family redox-associated membrane protein [Asaia spathodeae]|nr:MauE/DoxX family redox-associated membrane protein [Asaia spathodeae]GBR17216.1 hypothetical protein AA105894_1762 [Asaia spathodeae NBRC 105894]
MMGALALQMASALGTDAVGALFLGTGIAKMLDQPGFASVIASYRLVPLGAAFPVARLLTGAQILLGVWLCSGVLTREACLCAVILLVAFALAMGINVARGRTGLSCGCLPGRDTPLSSRSVMQTLLLALLMLGAGSIGHPPGALLGAITLLGGVSLLLLALAASQLGTAGDAA